MQTMFTDGDLLEKVVRLANRDKGLVGKIRVFLAKMAQRVISFAHNGLVHEADEARLLIEKSADLERLANVFAEGLLKAGENYGGMQAKGYAPSVNAEEKSSQPITQESARRKRVYGIGKGMAFPPDDESSSDANERAMRWARLPEIKNGDWRLAPYHDRWYIIEKFDNMPNGYLVTQYVPSKKMNQFIERWELEYGRNFEEELAKLYHTDNYYDRQAVEHGTGRSDFNDDVPEYSREESQVRGMGKSAYEGQQDRVHTDESSIGSNADRSGDGTSSGRGIHGGITGQTKGSENAPVKR